MVSLNYGAFSTDVYHKPTDTHQYLNFKCCHTPHVKRGIPYSEALRLKRICETDEIYESRIQELGGFLVKRGYKMDFVNTQIGRVKQLDRLSLLKGNKERTSKKG